MIGLLNALRPYTIDILPPGLKRATLRLDGAWVTIGLILLMMALFVPQDMADLVVRALGLLASSTPYILFAVALIAGLKATGAEALIAKAFEGNEHRMIWAAALMGGLMPFCSCEVIPFIAGLLAMGAPLAAIMAFWLASPLIDPPTFLITAGALGWEFAIGKAIAAVVIGLFGGYVTHGLVQAGHFASPLRPSRSSCCATSVNPDAPPVWRFWTEAPRRAAFRDTGLENLHFLVKWMGMAYLLEAVLIAYVPAEKIAPIVGGNGFDSVLIGALVGIPAYLNSYAAPPLVAGLIENGMGTGPAMAFILSGAMMCVPSLAAVFGLVRMPVFSAFLVLGFIGAVVCGLIFGWII